jgi:hypothetical protein
LGLASANQFRPGPPPAPDAPERAAEIAEVKNFKRTPVTNAKALYWQFGQYGGPGLTYRLSGVIGCFIGHGAYGFITKEAWVPFFGVVNIDRTWAYWLMPWVGAMDVSLGLIMAVVPLRIVLLHLIVWGLWTAALRPLSGDSVWEFLERAGNYGVPLAFLVLAGVPRCWRDWFMPAWPSAMTPLTVDRARMMHRLLRITTCLLLLGHGALSALLSHGHVQEVERWVQNGAMRQIEPGGHKHKGSAWKSPSSRKFPSR